MPLLNKSELLKALERLGELAADHGTKIVTTKPSWQLG